MIAFLRSIIEESGYRVHTYTSPHLIDFRERIRLAYCSGNSTFIEEKTLSNILDECESINSNEPITFFEITTAAAFLAFSRIPADILLLEVGLGGRLDATNLCEAEISIITSISHDHTEFLGSELKQIAFEKASIIKERGTVFAHIPNEEIFNVVNSLAQDRGASIYRLNKEFQITQVDAKRGHQIFDFFAEKTELKGLKLPLMGHFQAQNAGLALAACNKFLVKSDCLLYTSPSPRD